jgi:hypothetical protein
MPKPKTPKWGLTHGLRETLEALKLFSRIVSTLNQVFDTIAPWIE